MHIAIFWMRQEFYMPKLDIPCSYEEATSDYSFLLTDNYDEVKSSEM